MASVNKTKQTITFPPEMLPVATGPAEVILVLSDGGTVLIWSSKEEKWLQ